MYKTQFVIGSRIYKGHMYSHDDVLNCSQFGIRPVAGHMYGTVTISESDAPSFPSYVARFGYTGGFIASDRKLRTFLITNVPLQPQVDNTELPKMLIIRNYIEVTEHVALKEPHNLMSISILRKARDASPDLVKTGWIVQLNSKIIKTPTAVWHWLKGYLDDGLVTFRYFVPKPA